MSRSLITINSAADRARAMKYVAQAPSGTRVEFKATKRSLPQNDKLWALLTDIAEQHVHHGRKYPPATWKMILMHAWGIETVFVPSLTGAGIVPVYRSSDLSKDEMSSLIEFITAWATEQGITLHDGKPSEMAGERAA